MCSRAPGNGVCVAYANLCGQEGELQYTGMSCIIGPEGRDSANTGGKGAALLFSATHTLARAAPERDLQANALSTG